MSLWRIRRRRGAVLEGRVFSEEWDDHGRMGANGWKMKYDTICVEFIYDSYSLS